MSVEAGLNFNTIEFEGFRKEVGLNAFTMSPQKWNNATNAIGIIAKAGRYGGTYIYVNEADVLNVAMFGMTAKQWRVFIRETEWRTIRGNGSGGVRCERSRRAAQKNMWRVGMLPRTRWALHGRGWRNVLTDSGKWGADGVGMVQDAEREMGAADYCTEGRNVKRGCGVP